MPWSYKPSLDGVRAVAVYLVLLFHSGVAMATGGFVGVDVFFVLSGFLVSNVILDEIDRTGGLRVGRFYARRVRRLLPAALVVIVATSVMFLVIASLARRLPMVADARSALLYYANWHFASQSTDYFAAGVAESPFLHFWSLSVEEQFYVVFPLVLLGLCMLGRRIRWAVPVGLSVLLLLSVAAQVYWAQVDATHAYYGSDARFYQLLAGALLAVTLRRRGAHLPARFGAVASVGGIGLLVLLSSGLLDVSPSLRGFGATVASALVIAGVMTAADGLVGRFLARPVNVFLGRISYGTYLWHWPVILVLERVFAVGPVVIAVSAAAVATGLAAASYEVLEMPVRKTPLLDRFRWRTAVVGVACSALVAVTLVPFLLHQERKPALVASEFGAAPGGVSTAASAKEQDFDVQKAADSDRHRGISCAPDDIASCQLASGDGARVLVVGDSQALMLTDMFTEIAEKQDWQLYMNALPGCLWQEELINVRRPAGDRERCTRSRVGWYDEAIPAMKPDVVIVAARPYESEGWEPQIKLRNGQDGPLSKLVLRTTRSSLDKITGLGPKVALMERVITPQTFDPLDCLSSAQDISRCAVPLPEDKSTTDAYYITADAESDDVAAVDFNPAFCVGAPICQPVVDGEVVWVNNQHLTESYAAKRSDQAWRLLEATGLFPNA